jgi:hypothetical protein
MVSGDIEIRMGEIMIRASKPIPVSLSPPGEDRWGYHQFPTISRLPDGRLLVNINDGPDSDDWYGKPGPALVSEDRGTTWRKPHALEPLLTVSHSVISELYHGEFLCVPMSPAFDYGDKTMHPEVFGKMDAYGEIGLYRLDGFPDGIRDYLRFIPSVRWNPILGKWHHELVTWEVDGALVRIRTGVGAITRPYIDNRILRFNGLLLYPDYHLLTALPDGSCPRNYTCKCMASDDNGKSWHRHGLIAYDETDDMMMGEPSMVQTRKGELACVIRCTDHRQRPMLITYSEDGGRSWEEPKRIYDFGVMPQTLLLGNGVTVLSFGRPGIHLLFSADGSARDWTGPFSLIDDPNTCGYTRLLAVDDSSFIIVYSDFDWSHPEGGECKAIIIRKIEVCRE